MASKRRGGLRPPELRGTLGTLLRTTTSVVRDALERGAREGRARLDDARAGRRRQDALAELGELVLDLIRRGEIDLAELPEARDLIRQLDDLDVEPTHADREPPRAATRARFDARPRRDARAEGDGTVSSRASSADLAALRASRTTVQNRANLTETRSTLAPTKPIKGLWRTDVDAPGPPDAPAPRRPLATHDPDRKGGITFDDDDLNDYMHPDDVPAKANPSDQSEHSDPDDGEA